VKLAWYVVRTRPLAVFEVKERMEQCGVRCYCPLVWRKVRPSKVRKPRPVAKPAFPGYFFIAAADVNELSDMPHRRYQILRMSADDYLMVSDHEVEGIAAMEQEWIEADKPAQKAVDNFSRGEAVRVKGDEAGLFGRMVVKGFVGRYVVVELLDSEMKVDALTLEKVG
jgi:transcription antitermination factor NusG